MLIDNSKFDAVSIDAGEMTARVEPGATWGPLMKAAERHGLAGRAGFNPEVGVVRYTLGGGCGWLSRQYGLGCDAVVGADVMLADGSMARADSENNADLPWALRGGGGDAGISTALEIGLAPVACAYGGMLNFPPERSGEVLRLFAKLRRDTDPRLTTAVRMTRTPPGPKGEVALMVMLCVLGDRETGEALTRPWHEAQPAKGDPRRRG